MTIELTAEDAELIQKRLRSGVFQSIGDVIHDALAAQEAETAWLAANRGALEEKISRGIAQLDRGEGVSGEEAHAWLQKRKADWLRDQNR